VTAQELIQTLREAIANAEGRGVTGISPESLRNLLLELESGSKDSTHVESHVDSAHLEQYKAELNLWVGNHQHAQAWQLESFRAVIMQGQNALKSLILINGGAAVALLAFLGHLMGTGTVERAALAPLAEALFIFVMGVLFGSVAAATTYFSQAFFTVQKKWHIRIAYTFQAVTVVLGILGFVWFLRGAYAAYCGLIAYAI